MHRREVKEKGQKALRIKLGRSRLATKRAYPPSPFSDLCTPSADPIRPRATLFKCYPPLSTLLDIQPNPPLTAVLYDLRRWWSARIDLDVGEKECD